MINSFSNNFQNFSILNIKYDVMELSLIYYKSNLLQVIILYKFE